MTGDTIMRWLLLVCLLAAAGCGGGGPDPNAPNPDLKVPASTSDPNAKPTRGTPARR